MRGPRAILWVFSELPRGLDAGIPSRTEWLLRGVRAALPGTRHLGVAAVDGAAPGEGGAGLFDGLHRVRAEGIEEDDGAARVFSVLAPPRFAAAAVGWAPFLGPLLRTCQQVLDAHPDVEVIHLDSLHLAPLAVPLRRRTSAPIAVTAHGTSTRLAGAGADGSAAGWLGRRLLGLAAHAAHLTPLPWYARGRGLSSHAAAALSGALGAVRHPRLMGQALDAWYAAKVDLVFCPSEEDARVLGQMGTRTALAPDGVAAEHLEPVAESRRKLADRITRVPIFGFVGEGGSPFDLEGAQRLLEAFSATARLGRLRLMGVGLGKALESTAVFQRCPGATLVDGLSDVRPHLIDLDALVLPLFGGGPARERVMESVFAGVPLIASREAVDRLALEPSVDYEPIESASPEAVRAAVLKFLPQRERYQHRIQHLRGLWRERYDWPAIGRGMAHALCRLMADTSAAPGLELPVADGQAETETRA